MSKTPRIYQAGSLILRDSIQLSVPASHHVSGVLRMKPGEKLTIFCGDNREFDAKITSIDKKLVRVALLAEKKITRESPCAIHLVQAIPKGERMDFIVQKAVELGVVSITPLMTARSVVRLDKIRMEKKVAQWQAIAIAACEQSGRNRLPTINAMLTLHEYLKTASLKESSPLVKFVLHPRASKSWRDYTTMKENNIALLIGPEGGFTEEEMEGILSSGFASLCLGPRVLRTETAALAALGLLQAVWGDL